MRLRLFEHQRLQWLPRFATHPVTSVAAIVAVVLLCLWAIVVSDAKHVKSPKVPLVFAPR